jgi:hypothetical protein
MTVRSDNEAATALWEAGIARVERAVREAVSCR